VNECDAEFGTIPFRTVTVETIVEVPVHVAVVKRLYVTVPPAVAVFPDSVAESVTEPPTTTGLGMRLVEMVTVEIAGFTVSGSHALEVPLLLVSPL
jgi:hypothetical protein